MPAMNGSEDTLNNLLTQLETLRRGTESGRARPHKLVMLLAVLDLADRGELVENQVDYNEALIKQFQSRFPEFATGNDLGQPSQPFFHLRSAAFWHHKIRHGRETVYAGLTTSGGGSKRILENIEYAYLDDTAFSVFSSATGRQRLREKLMQMLGHE